VGSTPTFGTSPKASAFNSQHQLKQMLAEKMAFAL